MQFRINRDKDSSELRNEFMDAFKGLKIEFFHESHEAEEGSPRDQMIKGSLPLGALNAALKEGKVSVEKEMAVSEVEARFKALGLNVQVFRLMGRSWIETTMTDEYSLERQMSMSEESAGHS